MTNRTKWIALSAIGTVCVIIVLTSGFLTKKDQLDPGQPSSIQKVTLRLSWLVDASAAGYAVASEKGFYKKHGLEVDIKPGGIDLPPIKLVASGSGEFGQESGGETLVIARSKNIPVTAIAGWQPGGAPAIITLADRGIKTPSDLAKKRVAVGYGKPVEYVYRALLEHENVDRTSIEESVFKFDITPLLDGRIDAFTGFKVNQPFIIESQGFQPVVIDPNDFGVRTFGITLFTTDALIKDNPELVQKFTAASREGWKYAFEHPEEAINICLRQLGTSTLQYGHDIEVKKLKAYADTAWTQGKPLGWMDEKIWAEMTVRLNDYNILDEAVDPTAVFTNRFVETRDAR
jgi:NitT/TauT family transport system substrate-binding protein